MASMVYITTDAVMVCLAHALSTEREEVMGLLFGDVDEKRALHISSVIVLQRSDKQSDRVEISPEQLTFAATEAERLTTKYDTPMRVLGWYHSHPHITVWPSHVDVRTQAEYQMMDENFIGLIFSVFNEEKATKLDRIQMTCFQSINQSPEGEPPQYTCMKLDVPVEIVPRDSISEHCLESLISIPRILTQEEQEAYSDTKRCDELELVTRLHNCSVYTKSLGQLMDVIVGPLIQSLQDRLMRNEVNISELEKEKRQLQRLLDEDET